VAVLAIWPLMEQVLTFCVGMTDLLIAGRMSSGVDRVAVLDAMGLGGYVAWFFNILQIAVATGVMALVSRSTGARDEPLANRGLGQGVWLGLAAGMASFVVLQAGVPALIRWVELAPQAAEKAEEYLRIYAFSGPFSGVMLAINAALRGSGDTRTPFVGMLAVNGMNMAASWLFVFGPGPVGGHGIAGIGAGTVVGWVSGLVTVWLLIGVQRGGLRLTAAGLRPCRETMRRITRVGAPQALEIAGMWGIHAYGVRVISRLPTEGALGAHILMIRVESLSFLAGFAVATASAALVGQYLGAGSPAMAVRAVRVCWKINLAIMGAMGVVFLLAGRQMIALIAPDSAMHVELAAPLLWVVAVSQPFFATCIVLKTSMRGAGATALVIRYSFGSMIFFRIIVLAAAQHFGLISLVIVWIILSLDLLVQSIVFVRLHFAGKWLETMV
jgi:putative MATE family efflux protein